MNLLLVDPRGFGKSSSHPTIHGIMEDAESAYHFLCTQVKPETIIVWGESLGGSMAVHIASLYKCRSLILMATFSCLSEVAEHNKKAGGWMSGGLSRLIKFSCSNIPSKEWIRDVECPVVIFHSVNDDVIPYECGKILYRNAVKSCCKRFITIKGGHSSPDITESQLKSLFVFCDVDLEKFCPSDFTDTCDNIREAGRRHFMKYHTKLSVRKKYGK